MTTSAAPGHHPRWHHPHVHHQRSGWSWQCRCGAAGRSIVVARPWQAMVTEALWHASHAVG